MKMAHRQDMTYGENGDIQKLAPGAQDDYRSRALPMCLLLARWMVLFFIVLGSLPGVRAAAQTGTPWTPLENISRSPEQRSFLPLVLADSAGGLHVFWSEIVTHNQNGSAGDTIYYAHHDAQGWSEPRDILVAPSGKEVSPGGAAIGPDGRMALVWTDGTALFHSSAWPSEAGDARGWKTEVLVPGSAAWPDVYIDESGAEHVVWDDGGTIWYVRGSGQEWSTPQIVASPSGGKLYWLPRVAADRNGVVHAAWSETDENMNWESSGVWYAQSSDRGGTWTNQIYMPDRGVFIDVGLDGEDNVHLVWSHGIWSSEGRWHRYSTNGGLDWSPPRVMFSPGPANGMTGFPRLALDSDGKLHYVTAFNAMLVGDQSVDLGILHSEWSGSDWVNTEILPHASGEFPSIAISEGNVLSVVYYGKNHEIWYMSRLTGAEKIEPRPIAEPTQSTPLPTATMSPQPTATATPLAALRVVDGGDRAAGATNGSLTVGLAVAPAGILVAAVLLMHTIRRRR